MAQSAKRFAELLQKGIIAIADRTSKPKGIIHDELGYAIGRKGGSAIEYWAYGDGRIPRQQTEVAALARILVDKGNLDRSWLAAFLESASYPDREELIAKLIPNSSDRPLHNLPALTTPLVGRKTELAELTQLAADKDKRLITILGPGGMGKTRLALEMALYQVNRYENGVYFVSLAPLNSVEHIAPAIADAIGFQFQTQ